MDAAVIGFDPEDPQMSGVTGYGSGWASCACCGDLGYRFPNGLCGGCCYADHTACFSVHTAIRKTGR
jgi:hypothetical protein